MVRSAAPTLLLLLAAACVAPGEPPPTRWFEPARPAPEPARAEPRGVLELGRVDAPSLVPAIAWRLSPVELAYDPADRWTAEPEALVAEALRAALFESGRLREARAGDAARLDVFVRRFEGDRTGPPTAQVECVARWTAPDGTSTETRVFRGGAPLEGDGSEALARAMGRALGLAVSDLADWVESRFAPGS